MARNYLDSARLYHLTPAGVFSVTRPKARLCFKRRVSRPTDVNIGVRSDQLVVSTGSGGRHGYPAQLHREHYVEPEAGTRLVLPTNNVTLLTPTIAQLYPSRRQVELFFERIKQHLRINASCGTSANAVSVYVLGTIVKKRLDLDVTLHQLPQTLGLTLFEKTPVSVAASQVRLKNEDTAPANQLESRDL